MDCDCEWSDLKSHRKSFLSEGREDCPRSAVPSGTSERWKGRARCLLLGPDISIEAEGRESPRFCSLVCCSQGREGGRKAGRGAVPPAGLRVLCATQQVWGEAPLPGWMRMWMRMPPLLSWPRWEPERSRISQQQASNSWKQASSGRGRRARMGMVWE